MNIQHTAQAHRLLAHAYSALRPLHSVTDLGVSGIAVS